MLKVLFPGWAVGAVVVNQEEGTWCWPSCQLRWSFGGEKPDTSHRSQEAAPAEAWVPGVDRTWTTRPLGAVAAAGRSLAVLGSPDGFGECMSSAGEVARGAGPAAAVDAGVSFSEKSDTGVTEGA